ncbi:hypothetical protein [Ferrovibrio sp.]|uniref:hypothetical protein n=1 Tax=Ferrovibrio sp. TaxID=1917215 RepID=UPI0035B38A20
MSIDQIQNPSDADLPRLLARGLDSLFVSYYLDFSESSIDWAEIATAKERIKHARGKNFIELELGNQSFALMAYGRKPYTYILNNRLFEIALGEHMHPACTVRYSSEALWVHGFEALEQTLTAWFASLACRETRNNVISRADWAFDYDFNGSNLKVENFVTRASKDAVWRENQAYQTIQFGKGNVVIRIYDKISEIAQQSLKSWFFDIWKQRENVWRIEFQVRGSRLKQGGINTTAAIATLQNDLLRELAENHTTLRIPNQDSNRSRWPLHPLWQSLLADIAAMPQTGLVEAIDPEQAIEYRLHMQGKSVYGHLKSMAALKTIRLNAAEPISLEEMLKALPAMIGKFHQPYNWKHEVQQRIAKHQLGID